jgi:hypothetical protein
MICEAGEKAPGLSMQDVYAPPPLNVRTVALHETPAPNCSTARIHFDIWFSSLKKGSCSCSCLAGDPGRVAVVRLGIWALLIRPTAPIRRLCIKEQSPLYGAF